jgi:hypothetical protein
MTQGRAVEAAQKNSGVLGETALVDSECFKRIVMAQKKVLFKQKFEDPLFAIAFHPSAKQYVTGLSTGRVAAVAYDLDAASTNESWSTKRHKISCRALAYDTSGDCR